MVVVDVAAVAVQVAAKAAVVVRNIFVVVIIKP